MKLRQVMETKKNPREANFILQAHPVPAAWRELLKALVCRRSDRETEEFPIWWRIDGKGYTLWLSEVQLADSTSVPPTWRLKLETLATLPPAGKEHWNVCYSSIKKTLEDAELLYEIT